MSTKAMVRIVPRSEIEDALMIDDTLEAIERLTANPPRRGDDRPDGDDSEPVSEPLAESTPSIFHGLKTIGGAIFGTASGCGRSCR